MSDKGFGYYALLVGGIFVGILLGRVIGDVIVPTKSYRATSKVQQGYIVPSKLEIELQDLDGNGQKEVFMKYDGKNYLLTLDEQGRPRVQVYEVKPAEVVPKSE
mgnify:CR=1 FL=1